MGAARLARGATAAALPALSCMLATGTCALCCGQARNSRERHALQELIFLLLTYTACSIMQEGLAICH